MIVDDLHVMGVSVPPFKADPELVIDPNTMLALSVAFQCFQPKTRQFEVPKRGRRVQQFQSDAGCLFNGLKLPAELSIQQ